MPCDTTDQIIHTDTLPPNKRDTAVTDGIRVLNHWKVVNIIKYNFFFFENLLVIEIEGVEHLFPPYCLYGTGSY